MEGNVQLGRAGHREGEEKYRALRGRDKSRREVVKKPFPGTMNTQEGKGGTSLDICVCMFKGVFFGNYKHSVSVSGCGL